VSHCQAFNDSQGMRNGGQCEQRPRGHSVEVDIMQFGANRRDVIDTWIQWNLSTSTHVGLILVHYFKRIDRAITLHNIQSIS